MNILISLTTAPVAAAITWTTSRKRSQEYAKYIWGNGNITQKVKRVIVQASKKRKKEEPHGESWIQTSC